MGNLKCVGIVAEYNPFHNGHQYHVMRSRELTGADVVVAVMSGNFMQRGQMAMADKWTRAELAVKGGVDLVVELPTIFACNSAGYFAKAGVGILEALGVEFLSFGSECGNLSFLQSINGKMKAHQEEIDRLIREYMKGGMAYPKARETAVSKFLTMEEVKELNAPNNILALEYLNHLTVAKPITVERTGTGYHDMEEAGGIASATYIRSLMEQGEEVEHLVPEVPRRKESMDLFPLLAQRILLASAEELDAISGGGEGLGNKAKNRIRYCRNMEDLIEELKSKRYTRTRIERFLGNILLGVRGEHVERGKLYARVLAFNEKGSRYLKQIKKAELCPIPILTNVNKELENVSEIHETFDFDVKASDLWNLTHGKDLYKGCDFVERVRKI